MNVVIIDDEKKGRDVLRKMLSLINLPIQIIGEADSVKSGIELLSKLQPEVVFLDIRMEDGTGFSLLDQLNGVSFKVVFTTAYDEYAIKAFKYNAIDYLLKPIDIDELRVTVQRKLEEEKSIESLNINQLLDSIRVKRKKIAITSINETIFINEDDISRCEGENNYTQIYLATGKKITSTKTLKCIENALDVKKFYRIHNSHVINIDFIEKINNTGYVVMTDGMELEISRRRKKSFLDFFNKL